MFLLMTKSKNMKNNIRIAKIDDSTSIFEMIYSSGPDLYDFLYLSSNKSAKEYIAFEFKSGRGFGGYQNVTVITDGNEILGTGCFYSGKAVKDLISGTIKNIFKFYGVFAGFKIIFRMRHIKLIIKEPLDDELYLSNFGVDKNMRGTGIGRYFLMEKIAEARDQGYRIISLDVSDQNPRAEKLYESLGFELIEIKYFSKKYPDVGNAKKMELRLN